MEAREVRVRALVIGAAPCGDDGIALLARLAESAELVVAADGGGEHCLRAGVVPDVVVGDLDSLSRATERTLEAGGALVVRHPAEKDETDLDLALALVAERGATDAVLTCVLGGRLDQSLATLGSVAVASSASVRCTIREAGCTVWIADKASRPSLELPRDASRFSVIALNGPASVSVEGARWPLDHARLQPLSSHGVSNISTGDGAAVSVHEGVVAVIVDESA